MATHAADISLTGAAQDADRGKTAGAGERYLFGPVIDFLCLGGSTLLLFPLVVAIGDSDNYPAMAATMLLIAHLLNHPHFAASYQIFYRRFRDKALTPQLGRAMQLRYLFAGVAVPAALILVFLYGTVTADARLLGYCANLMTLAVGWHYVKQGYGMLMVDAVLKRRYIDNDIKKVLLVNCYVAWAASWMGFNAVASKQDLWGLAYYSFAIPPLVIAIATAIAAMTGVAAILALGAQWRRRGGLPINGVIAYFVSIYAWLMFVAINPIWALMVPALHSLQYLVVVGRFQLNYVSDQLANPDYRPNSPLRRIFGDWSLPHLAVFFVAAGAIGWLGFWGLPGMLDAVVPYDNLALTPALFLFVFWIFINVHHYFMDSVMWRRENPDTKKYLFS